MSEKDPTKMALQIAGMRASETHLPEEERVFTDPYAEFFFDAEIRKQFQDTASVKAGIATYEQMMPGVNGALVARVRFIDEVLEECLKKGLHQLVIIGAGYDTRAYRVEGLGQTVKVFEVDHPQTQKIKTDVIAGIFGTTPVHVRYVPVILGTDQLDKALLANGYNPELMTLYILEGLIMYLPPFAVDNLLEFITKASGVGSTIVTDYFDSTVIEGTSPLREARMLRQFVESEGSALQFGIQEGEVEQFFSDRGFEHVRSYSTEFCKRKYFKGQSLTRTVSPMFNFVQATVADKRSS